MTGKYKLTPGYIDVDRPGWEITSDYDDNADHICHAPFSKDAAKDDAKAQAWADQVIGSPQKWRRVEGRGISASYHFESC
ncbi:hypothetical protein ACIQF6_28480 [Kitasatospora sp. NPDC092948]|uniref:hypothetical protein n=1 Tax=Kitasatospora sp. NPDC092948 TaxID=3364088 RepID=UPI003800652D